MTFPADFLWFGDPRLLKSA